jgi:glutamyl-Q tRNA(Asp) synthetase
MLASDPRPTRSRRMSPRPFAPVHRYAGRFAPSPSGPLHPGSIVAALGSWLDARAADGRWLLRIEDLDPPRERAGAAATIRSQLQALGLVWDAEVPPQSTRGDRYAAALERLDRDHRLYGCRCTRRDARAWRRAPGSDEPVYPGTCRELGLPPSGDGRVAIRWRLPAERVGFHDRWLGSQVQHPLPDAGDPVLRRADGYWAYQLAVVVDDGDDGVTDVVRGRDLLSSTGRQILLQQALGLPRPRYLHLPLVVDDTGRKLSKHEGAEPAGIDDPGATLAAAAGHLGLETGLTGGTPSRWLDHAIDAWRRRLGTMPGDGGGIRPKKVIRG